MTSRIDRKAAIKEFKDRETPRGVFAVRCVKSDCVWVGSCLNLDATKNSLWFSLRMGSHPAKTLQSEWNSQGEDSFHYEILEKFDSDLHPLRIADLLKEKKNHWIAKLGACPLY